MNYQAQSVSSQLESGWQKYWNWCYNFFSKREPTVLKIGKKFPQMLCIAMFGFVLKRGGQITCSVKLLKLLAPMYWPQVSDYSVSFNKLNVRKLFQIGDNLSALFSSTICASTFTLTQHFMVKCHQHFVQRVVWSLLASYLQVQIYCRQL